MGNKKFVLIVEASQAYLRDVEAENFSPVNGQLFYALTNTYIPLLRMLNRIERDAIPFRMGLVLSPIICSLLSDARIQKQYMDHLDNLIALGNAELKRCEGMDCLKAAREYLESVEAARRDFTQAYSQNLVAEFSRLAKAGIIELIPTAATYAYLPHYAAFEEAVNAQVETGRYSQIRHFGEPGEGFYLPYCGWAKGFEWTLRSYGANYTVVDARSILFSSDCPPEGIFSPVRCRNSLVLFGKEPDTEKEIAGEEGFSSSEVYRDQSRDIGFELASEQIAPFFGKDDVRVQTGYSYWANVPDEFIPYDREAALRQVQEDAEAFYAAKESKLSQAENLMGGRDAVLVCSISAEILGQSWGEGIEWLEALARLAARRGGFEFALCRDLLSNQFSLPKIVPYPCSTNGLGYGEDLLDNSNGWMLRYSRKATERMIDLTDRFPAENSLKERLLNMAARQVLLAQSGEWAAMLHDKKNPGLVEDIFKEEILSFTKVFDSLASNTVSTEWLTECERKSAIFPWLNYRIFSRKR